LVLLLGDVAPVAGERRMTDVQERPTEAAALVPFGSPTDTKPPGKQRGVPAHKGAGEREAAMTKTAAWYIQGKPIRWIGRELGVHHTTVLYYLEQIRAAWLASMLQNFDAHRASAVARIDKLEAEAWDAWERSKKPRRSLDVKEKQIGAVKVKDRTYKRQTYIGNPDYLVIIGQCIERRCKLLGLDAPEKHESMFVVKNEKRQEAVQRILENPKAMEAAHKLIAVAQGLDPNTLEGEYRALPEPKE
jgi:hypothetical protein